MGTLGGEVFFPNTSEFFFMICNHRQVFSQKFLSLASLAIVVFGITLFSSSINALYAAEEAGGSEKILPVDDANLNLSPYVWKSFGKGPAARIEATMPGAYIKAVFQGTTRIGIQIDAIDNKGCHPASMPVVQYSIDDTPFKIVPLTRTGEVYTLPLAEGLDASQPHRLAFYFRAADLGSQRWGSSLDHLRIAGLVLDSNGSLTPCPLCPKRAIGYGDSITEGVGVDSLFTSWQILGPNNAQASWLPIVCTALNCEYGQLGSGGQGILNTEMAVPPLQKSWDRYDASASRLTDGKLLPEPDYVFCAMGTNDFGPVFGQSQLFTDAYRLWLETVRKACPHAYFFCITSPLGRHTSDIQAAVAERNKAGDARVYIIDTVMFQNAFSAECKPSRLAYDGVHPSMYGNAMLSALIVAEVQKALDKDASATSAGNR
jgi:lysophospholipase L1-like esterase